MVVVNASCFRQPYNKIYFKSFKFLKYKIQNKVKTTYFHRQFVLATERFLTDWDDKICRACELKTKVD
jgi:hypothetical protein